MTVLILEIFHGHPHSKGACKIVILRGDAQECLFIPFFKFEISRKNFRNW